MSLPSPSQRNKVIALAEEAGRVILEIYRGTSWDVTAKADESPLTRADLAANLVVTTGLRALFSEPVISEEEAFSQTDFSGSFWLVDPLDGTRDFVARLDTFVVCIALVEAGSPVFGVIHAPVSGETFWAARGEGAHGPRGRMVNRERRTDLIAGGSRSTPGERMKTFAEFFNIKSFVRLGSALKFCKLAEGEFDLYPRFGPTHEWDTAAGQIIAEEAGCKLLDIATGLPLVYGKPGLLNGGFVASRADLEIVGKLAQFKK